MMLIEVFKQDVVAVVYEKIMVKDLQKDTQMWRYHVVLLQKADNLGMTEVDLIEEFDFDMPMNTINYSIIQAVKELAKEKLQARLKSMHLNRQFTEHYILELSRLLSLET